MCQPREAGSGQEHRLLLGTGLRHGQATHDEDRAVQVEVAAYPRDAEPPHQGGCEGDLRAVARRPTGSQVHDPAREGFVQGERAHGDVRLNTVGAGAGHGLDEFGDTGNGTRESATGVENGGRVPDCHPCLLVLRQLP